MENERLREGPAIHDNGVYGAGGCPRGRTDCEALARYHSSFGEVSFMCCGETAAAPVKTDRLRLCVKSTHDNGPVDVMVHFDERDAVHTSSVLLAGLSALGSANITADDGRASTPTREG